MRAFACLGYRKGEFSVWLEWRDDKTGEKRSEDERGKRLPDLNHDAAFASLRDRASAFANQVQSMLDDGEICYCKRPRGSNQHYVYVRENNECVRTSQTCRCPDGSDQCDVFELAAFGVATNPG